VSEPRNLPGKLNFRVHTVQRVTARNGCNIGESVCTFSRLLLITSGRAAIQYHDRRFEVSTECAHLVPAMTVHECRGDDDWEALDIHFSSQVSEGVDLFSLLDYDRCLSPVPGDFRELVERLAAMVPVQGLINEPAQEEPAEHGTSLADCLAVQAILCLLLTPFVATARFYDDIFSKVARQFPTVHEFINGHLAEPILLADLAAVTGLHPTYFSHRFLQVMGLRPLEFLMRCRMKRAQYLLSTSKASIKEVAFDIGLRDPAYFSRVFMKYCHLSPSGYRSVNGL
jgi:AraC-like DNA-binding protein